MRSTLVTLLTVILVASVGCSKKVTGGDGDGSQNSNSIEQTSPTVQVSSSQPSALANGSDPITVDVTVTDATHAGVPNLALMLNMSGTNNVVGTGETDSNGVATFTVTSASAGMKTAQVTGIVNGQTTNLGNPFTLEFFT